MFLSNASVILGNKYTGTPLIYNTDSKGPAGARFSKAPETFRARKAIFS